MILIPHRASIATPGLKLARIHGRRFSPPLVDEPIEVPLEIMIQ